MRVPGGWDRIVMTEIRDDWAAKAQQNIDNCFLHAELQHAHEQQRDSLSARTEVYTHDATLPFSQLRKPAIDSPLTEGTAVPAPAAEPELEKKHQLKPMDVDAVVMNPPWGKRIGNLSLENAEDGAIVRSLLTQFVSPIH